MKRNNLWFKKKLTELRKERENKCEQCNMKKNRLEFAHIKPTGLNGKGRGRNRRVLDIMKNKDCYKLLCRSCHRDFDFQNVAEF